MSRTTLPSSFNAPSTHITRVFGAHPFHTDGDLLGLAFAADGTLWSVEEPGVLRRWDLDGRRQLGWHHLEELATLWAFSAGATLPRLRQRRPVGLGRRHGRAGGVLAAAVLGDGRGLLAGRRRAGGRLRRRRRPPLGLAATRPRFARGARPPLAGQRPGVQRGRRPAGLAPARTGPFTCGTRRRPAARQPDRPHRPHPRPGLAPRRPAALLGRLGHHGPRLGRGGRASRSSCSTATPARSTPWP